ncbi:FecCD family ABC transporter permease [Flavicella sediminum]|uniref:FecCD family ABC transporter permease n=1 Tax=Flavicella sediminum TaxID=2585141 RepID=UPI00111FBF65|nr:iron ABC transporter permease [Flavicella sediminum]
MDFNKTYKLTFIALGVSLLFVALLNISLGSIHIPFKELVYILFRNVESKESWQYIIYNFRIPKAITAMLVGSGLGVSGLLMQTLFRNPLAGPFVLGISSGASLGVACLILGSAFFGGVLGDFMLSTWSITIASSIGAFLVLSSVLIAIKKIRNTMSILIVGLMFGSISAAIINVLSYFSSAEQLQQFIFWSFGSLGNLSWNELTVFFMIILLSTILLLFIIKPLNSLLLGESYAISLGVNIKKTRYIVLITTSLMTGVITAFSGPIAFVGLAIPHLTKLIFNTSDHRILLPAVAINGAILMLVCDAIAQLPTSEHVLPINAVTSLFGAPIVIWLLVRKQKNSL